MFFVRQKKQSKILLQHVTKERKKMKFVEQGKKKITISPRDKETVEISSPMATTCAVSSTVIASLENLAFKLMVPAVSGTKVISATKEWCSAVQSIVGWIYAKFRIVRQKKQNVDTRGSRSKRKKKYHFTRGVSNSNYHVIFVGDVGGFKGSSVRLLRKTFRGVQEPEKNK